MKKLLILTLLFTVTSAFSQSNLRFMDQEYFTFTTFIDPGASIKEKSIDIGVEIQVVSYWKYVSAGVEILPGLEGGYASYHGAVGVNLTSGYFSKVRYYAGLRLGNIKRGFSNGDTQSYPLFGYEAGIDYEVTNGVIVGLRTTSDRREDFKYSGANPEMQQSGSIKIGVKF